jgi:hypothetical protein
MSKPEDQETVEGSNAEAASADDGECVTGAPEVTRREFVATVGATVAAVTVIACSTTATEEGTEGAVKSPLTGTPIYRIHPAIGVARMGNADPDADGYIIGPEIPGQRASDPATGDPVDHYKANGKVKPQAARFRIFEYRADANGKLAPVGEVLPQTPTKGTPYIKAITWKVHVANRKASFYEEDGPHGETLPAGALRNPTITDRASLESDFGPRTITGKAASGPKFTPGTSNGYAERVVKAADGSVVIDYLGQLRTDGAGRLLVFAGKGTSRSSINPPQALSHWSNNNYWFDDVADGPVTAVVTIDDGKGHLTDVPMDAAGNAWVLAAPPDFSPGLNAATSLYEMLYDMGVRSLPIPTNNALYSDGGPLARMRVLHDAWAANGVNTADGFEFGAATMFDYQSEVWPLILNAVNYVYTTGLVNFKHGAMMTDPLGDPSDAAAQARGVFFSYIRAPADAATNTTGPATMPRLYGDNWYVGNENFVYSFGQNGPGNPGGGAVQGTGPRNLPKYQRYETLTPTQYGMLRSWNAGHFTAGTATTAPLAYPDGGPLPVPPITPHGLDRAALENCIGGPFYPGIECSWQMRNPKLFIEPFRLKPTTVFGEVQAGDPNAATSQYLKQDGTPELTPLIAGHFSRQMALPWHADFNDCDKLLNLGWWPSARPDDVFLNATDKLTDRVPGARPDAKFASGGTSPTYEDMVANWYKFGFILQDANVAGVYVEKERNASVP